MWATGPVSASLTYISEQSALGWVWFDLTEPLPRPSLPSSCHRRARQGCGQGGGGSERAAPALLTPGHSQALSWPSPGMGLGWIPRPSLGKHGGCPPAHTSPLLSPSVAPRGASRPWQGLTPEAGVSQLCWDRGPGRGWTGILATRALTSRTGGVSQALHW